TLVAGVIGAKNDSTVGGIVGVAPGTKIYAVKVLDANGSGSTAQVICGIDWVTANAAALGIKAVNMSLGGPGRNDGSCGNRNHDPLHQAICRSAGVGLTFEVSGTSIATPHVTGAVALCLGNGSTPATPCGGTPAQIIQRLRADAAAHAAAVPGYGFAGDPQHPVGNRYYGNLVWAGDY